MKFDEKKKTGICPFSAGFGAGMTWGIRQFVAGAGTTRYGEIPTDYIHKEFDREQNHQGRG